MSCCKRYNEWVQSSNPTENKGSEPEGFMEIDLMLEAPTTR